MSTPEFSPEQLARFKNLSAQHVQEQKDAAEKDADAAAQKEVASMIFSFDTESTQENIKRSEDSIILTANLKMKSLKKFPSGQWWKTPMTPMVFIPLEKKDWPNPQQVKEIKRIKLLKELNFLNDNGELTENTKVDLITPHENSQPGQFVFFAQSTRNQHLFLMYIIRAHRNTKTHKLDSFIIHEYIQYATNPEKFKQTFKKTPIHPSSK